MNLKNIANSSLNTHEFYKNEVNISTDQYPIAVDIGYSSVKICSKYGKHSFPSFVIPLESHESIIVSNETDILYRESNKIWVVGKMALDTVEKNEIMHYEKFYSREKIRTLEYKILARVALYFGLLNKEGQLESTREVYIKTGLPEIYLDEDAGLVRDVFKGNHNFEVKFGNRAWQRVTLDISDGFIGILSQPLGTIWNVASEINGVVKNPEIIAEKKSIVLDIGFFSVDVFLNQMGSKSNRSTSFQLGMFEVLKRTCNDIFEKVGVKVKVYELQKYILSEKFPFSVFYGSDNQIYNFKNDLSRNLTQVAEQIISEMRLIYDNFRNVDVLILSGGASIAMKEYFNIPHNVQVVSPADSVFANCQGFFSCLAAQLKKG